MRTRSQSCSSTPLMSVASVPPQGPPAAPSRRGVGSGALPVVVTSSSQFWAPRWPSPTDATPPPGAAVAQSAPSGDAQSQIIGYNLQGSAALPAVASQSAAPGGPPVAVVTPPPGAAVAQPVSPLADVPPLSPAPLTQRHSCADAPLPLLCARGRVAHALLEIVHGVPEGPRQRQRACVCARSQRRPDTARQVAVSQSCLPVAPSSPSRFHHPRRPVWRGGSCGRGQLSPSQTC